MGTVTSPFHGNVQFDRHPTEGCSGFSALREYRNPSPRGQSRTREAQPPQSGGLFGIDVTGGLFGMQAGSYGGGRSVMFESPGQSGRPTLQANAVRGPSPGPRSRSRSVSPSRGPGSSSMGGRGFVPRGGYQNSGRGRGWNGMGRPVVMQRNIATEETVKAVVPPVATSRSSTPFATSPMEEWAQSASTQVPTCMYCGQRGHWMMGCAERLANEAKTMAVARGGTEMKGG